MVLLSACTTFLDTLLDINSVPSDNSNNGLQVEGMSEVTKVAFAVDASLETFQKAVAQGAQLLVVHHGISWNDSLSRITGVDKKRMSFLMEHQLSLYAAHLPLDRHLQYGNNVQLAQLLGLQQLQHFGNVMQTPIGVQGMFSSPQTTSSVVELITTRLGEPLHVWDCGTEQNTTVAVCSGSGGSELPAAVALHADLFVTGELHHNHSIFTKEAGINVIAAGHYATETLGVRALMKPVQEKQSVETIFIDAPTGL